MVGFDVLSLPSILWCSHKVERGEGTFVIPGDLGLRNIGMTVFFPTPCPSFFPIKSPFFSSRLALFFSFRGLRGLWGIQGNQGDREVKGDLLCLLPPLPCPLPDGLSSSSCIKPQCHSLVQAGSLVGVADGHFFRIGTDPQVGGGAPVEPWALLSDSVRVRVRLPLLTD